MYTPDYNDLHDDYERERERRLEKYPKCDLCGEPITDDEFFDIDGTYFHEACLNSEYRKYTNDYIEE